MKRLFEEIKRQALQGTEDLELAFVFGSYAFGTMQKYSDIDVRVLTTTAPKKKRMFRFLEHKGRKVLLTVHFDKFTDHLKEIKDPNKWIWVYLPFLHAKVLVDKNQNMEKTKKALEKHKVSNSYFFNLIPREASYLLEYVGKLKNAYLERDELNLLYAARAIAELCYNLVKPFNPLWKYTSERETFASYISLEKRPPHYVDDFKTCYGLTIKKRSAHAIYKSALRLANGTTIFLKQNKVNKRINDKDFLRLFKSKEYTDYLR